MRSLPPAVITALNSGHVYWTVLAEFDFASGVQRVWAGPQGYALQYQSVTWNGLGTLGEMDKISEGTGFVDSRTTVSLRIPSDLLDGYEFEDSRNRNARILVVLLDSAGTPIGDIPGLAQMGQVRVTTSLSQSETAREVTETIEMELLLPTAILDRSHVVRMTNGTQQRISPGDWGLEFAADPEMGNLGRVADTRAGGGGGGGPIGQTFRRFNTR